MSSTDSNGDGLALHDPFLDNLLYKKIRENEQIVDYLYDFIPTYCKEIVTLPAPFHGGVYCPKEMEFMKGVDDFCVFRIYFNSVALYTHRANMRMLRVTAWHELLHIMFYVVGHRIHDENKISNTAWHLSYKYPQILQVIESYFPGLDFNNIPEFEKRSYQLLNSSNA